MCSSDLNATIGTRFKVISGYPGGAEALLAVERGEVEGYALVFWSTLKATKPDWLKNKDINLLVQLAVEPHPELKDVPLVTGYAKSEADRQALNFLFEPLLLGRPYFAPPGISPTRLATLRAAFTATMKDAAFLAEAKARDMEIIVKDGTQTEKIVRDVYATPKDVIARVAAIRTEK